MTKRDILSVAFKILGVVSIMRVVLGIPTIGMSISMAFQQPKHEQYFNPYWFLGTTSISLILNLAMAYILLRWGDLIAKKLIRDDAVISLLRKGEWEKPIFMLSLRIMGVVCLVKSVPGLIKILPDLISVRRYQGATIYHTEVSGIGAIVVLIIGLYLISGGKHLAEFAYREKNGNTR
ncbi:MAG: hypothetical protein HY606_04265 [Planctomycetes bacterium]|nr:hypothetical protein [Planctomycetota bacterium]